MELYLHIPFCIRKCAYCDFLSFACGKEKQRQYVEKLIEEIDCVGAGCQDNTVSTVFVGGGTPSVLDSAWIVEIFEHLRRAFWIEEGAEISMEANPGTVTREKLLDYRRAGINRLSLGLQSASDRELRLLGRIHTWDEFLESYRLVREAGFENVNVDLMSALPGQTVESWLETLRRVTDLGPEHISAYSLIVEEGTPFFAQYGSKEGQKLLPDEDAEREMYHGTLEFLRGCGYERYEISNYARAGRECRHNLGYWTGVPYLGLGLGASSYMDGKRFCNVDRLEEYLGGKPGEYVDVQELSVKDMQEEFFYVGLRLVRGVCLSEFERRFGVAAAQVYPGVMERFVREGVAEICEGWFRLTEFGMDVSNYVMGGFLQ